MRSRTVAAFPTQTLTVSWGELLRGCNQSLLTFYLCDCASVFSIVSGVVFFYCLSFSGYGVEFALSGFCLVSFNC